MKNPPHWKAGHLRRSMRGSPDAQPPRRPRVSEVPGPPPGDAGTSGCEGPKAEVLWTHIVKCPVFSVNTRCSVLSPGSQCRGLCCAGRRPDSADLRGQAPGRALGQKQGPTQGGGEGEEEEEAQKAVSDQVAVPQVSLVVQVPVEIPPEGEALPPQRLPDGTALQVGACASPRTPRVRVCEGV